MYGETADAGAGHLESEFDAVVELGSDSDFAGYGEGDFFDEGAED